MKNFKYKLNFNVLNVEQNTNSMIFKDFLNNQNSEYIDTTTNERKVIDYIAGMTDDYILRVFNTITEKTDWF